MSQSAEMTDVVVVLDNGIDGAAEATRQRLAEAGLEVSSVDADNGVIEGSVETGRLPQIKAVPGVCYVRNVFSYMAEHDSFDPDAESADD